MLTGESIPVSKTPINDDDLAKWKEGGDVTVAMAKGLLYAGTQVVRTRGNIISGQALALVARTGWPLNFFSITSIVVIIWGFQASTRLKAPSFARCSSPNQSGSSSIEIR